MMSMGSNMSTTCFLQAVLTGAFAPEKRSRKNRGLQETSKLSGFNKMSLEHSCTIDVSTGSDT